MQGWDFEKPIIELEEKIEELRNFSDEKKVELSSEILNLESRLKALKKISILNLLLGKKFKFPGTLGGPLLLIILK